MQRSTSCLSPRCVRFRCLCTPFSTKSPAADHYGVLGIKRDAKQKDVKDAFYKLSKIYHPDVNRDEVALQKFQDITAAYETLGTPESRDAYDVATQPVMHQRLSSANQKRTTTPDDYTLLYRMRKRAHEKIRIKTHPQSGATDGKQNSAPGYYASGHFDEKLIDELRQQYRSAPEANNAIAREIDVVSSSSILVGCLVIIFSLIALNRSESYVPKGTRDHITSNGN